MKKIKLRIGGVPEHFNLPWHLSIKSGALKDLGIDATWTDYPSGTGSMVNALNNNKVDVAMLLTEGAVKAQAQGSDFEIISLYTQSPLIWGVHVPVNSKINSIKDLTNAKFAISRFGSGSHLMAYLLAEQEQIPLEKNQFEIIDNLAGARKLFKQGGDYVFLWEKFMTQPYVDQGVFKRIDTLPTPWPCFVVCVRKDINASAHSTIIQMLNSVLQTANDLKASPIAEKLIAAEYSLKESEVTKWLEITHWAKNAEIESKLLGRVHKKLCDLGLISALTV